MTKIRTIMRVTSFSHCDKQDATLYGGVESQWGGNCTAQRDNVMKHSTTIIIIVIIQSSMLLLSYSVHTMISITKRVSPITSPSACCNVSWDGMCVVIFSRKIHLSDNVPASNCFNYE